MNVYIVTAVMSNNNQSCGSDMNFDISTPDGSGTDNDHLSAADKPTMRDCKEFAHAVLKLVDDVERTGATDQALPEFPKSELLEILGRSKPKRC